MRIFLDANILVSVVNKEYPVFPVCAKILSLSDRPGFQLYTSSLSLAITWYFVSKKHGSSLARKKMELLLANISIADCGSKETLAAIELKKADDFEDAMQYYSALNAGCDHIVTSNIEDFYFSEITVSSPEAFFRFLY